jgi:serine/threonine protein kinase
VETAGHYRILGPLGAGGMGVVYRAEDTRLGRQVALKFLPASQHGDGRAAARLEREARTASALNHPNICTIYEIGDADGRQFIAMELLEGAPLQQAIGGRALDAPRLIDLATQIADALDAAHATGIVHRDIKPANIFVTRRGHAKVLDFGIAHTSPELVTGETTPSQDASTLLVTQPGSVTGTIAYMSPEQALSQPVDARSDIFSFGLVLFEMGTGRQAFEGHTPAALYDAILNRQPPAPSAMNGALPAGFDAIVARALEKDPSLRYQTASDLRADLQRIRRDLDTARLSRTTVAALAPAAIAPPPSAAGAVPAAATTASVPTPAPRRWVDMLAGAIGVVLLATLVAAVVVWQFGRHGAPPASAPSAPPAAPSPSLSSATATSASTASPVVSSAPTPAERDQATAVKPPSKPRVEVTAPSPAPPAVAAPPAPFSAAAEAVPPSDSRDRGAAARAAQAPGIEAARQRAQNGDPQGAISDLRAAIARDQGDHAPIDTYRLLVNLEERHASRADLAATLKDLGTRFPGDPRAPAFLLQQAENAASSARPGRVAVIQEASKAILTYYPASPHAEAARALLQEYGARRGGR